MHCRVLLREQLVGHGSLLGHLMGGDKHKLITSRSHTALSPLDEPMLGQMMLLVHRHSPCLSK
jgi:hypothetical protein